MSIFRPLPRSMGPPELQKVIEIDSSDDDDIECCQINGATDQRVFPLSNTAISKGRRILPPSLNYSKKTISSEKSTQLIQPPFANGNFRYTGESSNSVDKKLNLGGFVNDGSQMLPSKSFVRNFRDSNSTFRGSDDKVEGYIREEAHSSRVLPPSLVPRKIAASGHEEASSRVLPTSVLPRNVPVSGFVGSHDLNTRPIRDDRVLEKSERVIYQEVLQSMQHHGQPKVEDDLPEGVLAVPLLKHQRIALAWMVQKENSSHCAGGILADDQGLGKTVSTIALILKHMDEQINFTSASSHAKVEALDLEEDDDDEVVEIDEKKAVKVEPERETHSITSSKRFSSAGSSRPSAGTRPAAGTLVVCPASILKQWANELSDKVTSIAELKVLIYHGGGRTKDPNELAKYDVVLTSYTIVTNELPKNCLPSEDDPEQCSEKYGLTSELNPYKKRKPSSNARSKKKRKGKKHMDEDIDFDSGPLARVRWFRIVLDEAQTIKNYRTQVSKACCGLRAKRRWCLSGTPIQNTIDDLFSYFRFLKFEPLSVYSTFRSSIKYPIARNASQGYKKLQAVLKTVLLRRTKDTQLDGEPIVKLPPKSISLKSVDFTIEERSFYLALEESSRQKFKDFAAAGTVKQNYASILLMLLRLRQACDHPFLVNDKTSDVGKDAINRARQLPREMLEELYCKLQGSAICNICSDIPEDAVVAMCGHLFCYQCIYDTLTSDENACPASNCGEVLSTDSVFSEGVLKLCQLDNSERMLTASSASTSESGIKDNNYISTKIRAALNILDSIFCSSESIDTASGAPQAPVKAIVFSQWTGMLDLVELSLNRSLIQYRRLDGTMTLNVRDRAVKEFNTDPEIRVMLMSLKAGNLGLNMVAACHVILLDLWWNPYAEDQAVDRAHRIGQTRPVTVSRLTIKDTVEDRILSLQEEKRKIVNSAFGETSSGHTSRLTMEDLMFLFRV